MIRQAIVQQTSRRCLAATAMKSTTRMIHHAMSGIISNNSNNNSNNSISRGGIRYFVTKQEEKSGMRKSNTPQTVVIEKDETKTALIKTNLTQHFEEYKKRGGISPDQPIPHFEADPSGIVDRDLTSEIIDLKDIYDPRLHLANAPDFSDTSVYEKSTPLTEEIISYLAVTNTPMTIAEFMRQALTHPLFGYYTNPTLKRQSQSGDNAIVDVDDDDDDDDDDDWNQLSVDSEGETEKTVTGGDMIIGPKGDFVTAPEVSQIFGESLAVWFVTQFQTTMGASSSPSSQPPKHTQLIELGPGKGTLMADMLTFLIRFAPDCGNTLRHVHFVEASPAMRSAQKAKLEALQQQQQQQQQSENGGRVKFVFKQKDEKEKKVADDKEEKKEEEEEETHIIHVHWHDSFANVIHTAPELPSFIVGQEFIDALPVHVFEKKEEGYWRERLIDVAVREEDEQNNEEGKQQIDDTSDKDKKDQSVISDSETKVDNKDDKNPKDTLKTRLRIVVAPGPTPATKTLLNVDETGKMEDHTAPIGQVIEVCPEGILFVQDVAKFLEKNGGAALIIDYGQEGTTDSLRGFSNHKQINFLSQPGRIDITADVDFTALKHAVQSLPAQTQKEDDTINSSTQTSSERQIQAFGPITQGQFLASMGAMERVVALIEDDNTTDEQAERYFADLQRLVAPDQMGERYKVLAITKKKEGIFPPPGFS